MRVSKTTLSGVLLVEPNAHGDQRGLFMETFHAERYAEAGINEPFVQDNFSRSRKGILRGLHFQEPKGQGKLVYVLRGAVFDVAVDVRKSSPNFGKWVGVTLSDENHHQLWIPPGFAHGFCVLSDEADFLYKCTEVYAPDCDRVIAWNDPDIGVKWPVGDPPILSAKDQAAKSLREAAILPA